MMLIAVEETEPRTRSVFLMSGAQIDEHWANIQLLMAECPGFYDFYTPEWTYKAAKEGNIQLWALSDNMIRGIIVTQVLVFPAQKAFEILAAAGIGLLDFFDEMESVFEYIARDAGCKTIITRARPGIARLLSKRGATTVCSFLYRPVGVGSKQ